MLGKAWEWMKSHPIITVFIIGAIGLLILFTGSSSSASSGGSVSYGPSDAEIAAGTQLSLAQMGYAAQANQTNAQLQAVQIGATRDVSIANVSADVAKYQTEQAANVQSLGISAQKDIQMAGFQSQQVIALAQAATQVRTAEIAADITKTGYYEQTKQLGIYTSGMVAQTDINANTYVELAKIQQKEKEVDRFYDYKMAGKTGGNSIGGILGGIVGAFF